LTLLASGVEEEAEEAAAVEVARTGIATTTVEIEVEGEEGEEGEVDEVGEEEEEANKATAETRCLQFPHVSCPNK